MQSIDPRPAMRLVGDRTRHDGAERRVASRRFGRVWGRIGSALAMAAAIAVAFVIGIPAPHVALPSHGAGMRAASETSDAAPFAATLGRSSGVEPVLVSLLQNGHVGQDGQDGAAGMSTLAWPGLRAVPISADSSTSELLSIIEARDVRVDDLADDVARMRRDVNDRS